MEGILANPAEFAKNPDKLREMGEEFGRVEDELSALLNNWEELEMKK